jgi:phosphopantothenoylcysteine decarboxylase/phosphopantothenate--cysteine ligase
MVKNINPRIFLVGFKAAYDVTEEELVSMAQKSIKASRSDFIVANDVSVEGTGFGSEDNQVIIVDNNIVKLPLSSKTEIAKEIIEKIIEKIR